MVSNGCCLVKANQSGSWSPGITLKAARLKVRRNFFSQRVTSEWNNIPSQMKNGQQCGYIQERFYKTPCKGGLIPGEMENGEYGKGRILSERPHRSFGESTVKLV
jgi:hypothetical protein